MSPCGDVAINRWTYTYRPRRRRPRRRGWLLSLLLAAAVALGLSGFQLTKGGGQESNPPCSPGSDCPLETPALQAPAARATIAPRPDPLLGTASGAPAIGGRSAAIIEGPCGAFLYGLNPHQRLAPASLTKIVTALVAVERTEPDDLVEIRIDGAELSALTDSTVMGLEPGQRLSMRDLLYGLLLPSGNDAALAIAEHVGGTVPAFVDLMNGKVRELGLADTRFFNPHGLDGPDMYTSAYDMAVLGRELMRDPDLAAIVGTQTYQPAWDGSMLWNDNLFLYFYEGALGVKIGYTDEARLTLVAAAQRQGRLLIAAILGSENVYQEAAALLDWAFANTAQACGG